MSRKYDEDFDDLNLEVLLAHRGIHLKALEIDHVDSYYLGEATTMDVYNFFAQEDIGRMMDLEDATAEDDIDEDFDAATLRIGFKKQKVSTFEGDVELTKIAPVWMWSFSKFGERFECLGNV